MSPNLKTRQDRHARKMAGKKPTTRKRLNIQVYILFRYKQLGVETRAQLFKDRLTLIRV